MSPRSGTVRREPALLVLADGAVFEGEALGHVPDGGVSTGEAVFNTVLSGYQEVITDPSYAGQVIAFTYPHIGNYGVNAADDEAARPHCRGVIVRDLADAAVELALGRAPLEAFLIRSRGVRHHRDRHPPADPPSARPRLGPVRVRHGRPKPTSGPRPGRHRRPTGGTWCRRSPRRRWSPGGAGPTGWWPTTSGSRRPCSASSATWPP